MAEEIIHWIEEKTWKSESSNWVDLDMEGYEIKTNRQTITIAIDSEGQCCERFGYMTTDANFAKYSGALLLGIERCDKEHAVHDLVEKVGDIDDGDAIFITVLTSKGEVQFAVYNEQNGYYGHNVTVRSEQLTVEEVI